jgi:hypothetical protein
MKGKRESLCHPRRKPGILPGILAPNSMLQMSHLQM